MLQHTTSIPAEVARHVLWQFDTAGGHQPGTFTQHLMRAFCAADIVNFHRLSQTYPDYGAAVYAAQNDENGITRLQDIARGDQ
ncbi:hypothetical protein ACLIYM_25445 [Streptomyces fenghuangensis]